MNATMPRRGLYAVTDSALTQPRGLLACVESALKGGAALVQYRDKNNDQLRRREEARALLALCERFGVPLIINDDVELARDTGAHGVHVGREDAAVASARAALGPAAIIGASCYHELERAEAAEQAGATYVAFGRFFTSRTKPGTARATPDLLREARARISLPIVAIGGIRAGNAASLITAGADMVAVIDDLWSGPDCEDRARALSACFDG